MSTRRNLLFTRHIQDVWADDNPGLFEAGEQVKVLLFSPGWQAIERVLDAEIALIDADLDYGKPKEQAEYAYEHGRRSAFRSAAEAARAIVAEAKAREAKAQQAAESAVEA